MVVVVVAAGTALAACYGHQATHRIGGPRVARLPPSTSGHYDLIRGGQRVGRERLTVTASTGWAMQGELRFEDVVGTRARYALRLDGGEPARLEVELDVLDRVRTLSATVGAGYVHVTARGLGQPIRRKVPYARGTMLDVLSPGLRIWSLALLSDSLRVGAAVPIRTVRFEAPTFAPHVELQTLEVKREQDGLRLIRLVRPGGAAPEALWVDADGFVVRARSWPKGPRAPFVERRWIPK